MDWMNYERKKKIQKKKIFFLQIYSFIYLFIYLFIFFYFI